MILSTVVVVGYAVEPLVADRSKVRFQTMRDTGVYDVRGRAGFASGRVCSSDVPVLAAQRRRNSRRGPRLFKKAKLRDQGQLKERVRFLVGRNLTLSPALPHRGRESSF